MLRTILVGLSLLLSIPAAAQERWSPEHHNGLHLRIGHDYTLEAGADLAVVHPTRHRPRGEVATFTGKQTQAAETEPVAIATEDYGAVMLHLSGGARGNLWVSQVTAGRKKMPTIQSAATRTLLWGLFRRTR